MKIIAIFLTVCLLFCGCGKTDSGSGEGSSQAPVHYDLSKYQEINMYAIRENNLNPLLVSSESGRLVLSLIFRPLFTVDQKFDCLPCLAENVTFSNGCKTVDITLKKDVLWDDGSSFTSSDVDYTVNKIIEYGEESPYFQYFSNVEGYAANGTHGYRFNLTSADAGFPALLTFPIVKRNSLGNSIKFIGTGDYTVKEYKEYSSLLLVSKNLEDKTNICKIKVSLLPDNSSAFSGYKLGQIDLFKLSAEDALSGSVDEAKSFVSSNTNRYSFLAVNHASSLLSDPALRRIISQITSAETVTKDLAPDFAISADSMVNPAAHFAIKNEASYDDLKIELDSLGYTTDESGTRIKKTSDGNKKLIFDIIVNGENHSKVIAAQYIANLLSSYGINTTVRELEYTVYTDALKSGSFDLALCETAISLNNDYTFLLGSEGSMNFGGYSSKKADSLLTSIAETPDKSKRTEYLNQLQTLFFKDMPHIPLWFKSSKIVYNNSLIKKPVLGGISDDFGGISTWKLK